MYNYIRIFYLFIPTHSLMPRSCTGIHSFIRIHPQRPSWQEPEPSHVTGVALAHCILGKFLGVVCIDFPRMYRKGYRNLIYRLLNIQFVLRTSVWCLLKHMFFFYFMCSILLCRGPGSSVGIATDYGLDVPGSNPGGDEIFRQSRPALGPTQLPVKWVLGLCRG